VAHPHIISILIDDRTLPAASPADEQERQVAVADLIAGNHVACPGAEGPFRMSLSLAAKRLTLAVADATTGIGVASATLSLARLRRPMADYLAICRSHRDAAAGGGERLQTIDMARRALHNDAATALQDQLAPEIAIDFETARRFFTLLCALDVRG